MDQDQILYRNILKHFARGGRPPSVRAIGQGLGRSRSVVRAALDRLEAQRAFYRDPCSRRIVAAYPFSARRTAHRVTLPDGRSLYALCAIDALGMPLMLGSDATITSACE